MANEEKIKPTRFRILVHDNEIEKDLVCLVMAKSFHHATNLIYQHGLVPIREATDRDYDMVYGTVPQPIFTIREGLPEASMVVAQ